MIPAKARALLYIAPLLAALTTGWLARGWYVDSRVLSQVEAEREAERKAYKAQAELLALEMEKEAQASAALRSRIRQTEAERDALREKINVTVFTPPVVDGCARHVAADPAFYRLLREARRGSGTAEADQGGMSPRDD